ncbi:hypothetical protein QZH41_003608 [Actinostola sp. cb2023]|nr:hypothetical protein QZH41_003608 [Actinostola sp. cb2023]
MHKKKRKTNRAPSERIELQNDQAVDSVVEVAVDIHINQAASPDLHVEMNDSSEPNQPTYVNGSNIEDIFEIEKLQKENEFLREELADAKEEIKKLHSLIDKNKRFDIEKYKHSDKDIEFYTGFSSYKMLMQTIMAKLDLKLVMIILALVLLVTLLDNVDASSSSRRRSFSTSRRRSISTSRRRRSSYGGTSRSTSSSSGLVIGLTIFGVFMFLIIGGFIIGYCCCRKSRRQTTGSIITPQPEVQYRTEYQTGNGSEPPPYTLDSDAAYPTKGDTGSQPLYPPPGDATGFQIYPPPQGPPGATPIPHPYPYPTKDASALPYQSNMENQPQYPPPGDATCFQAYPPPQGLPGETPMAYPHPGNVPANGETSASPLPPPSYDDAVKENQGDTRGDETKSSKTTGPA